MDPKPLVSLALCALAGCHVHTGHRSHAPVVRDAAPGAAGQIAGPIEIEVVGSVDVSIRVGYAPTLRFAGDPDVLATVAVDPATRAVVVDSNHDELFIDAPSLAALVVRGSGDVEVTGRIAGPAVVVDAGGSGDVELPTVAANEFRLVQAGSGDVEVRVDGSCCVTIDMRGSGDLEISGTARDVIVHSVGSGDVDASGLATDTAIVEVNGSSDVAVHARLRFQGSANASGDIEVHGAPAERYVDETGSGDIEFR